MAAEIRSPARRRIPAMRCTPWLAVVVICLAAGRPRVEAAPAVAAVVCPKSASFAERLAAKEIRRCLYLRTGRLLPLVLEKGDSPIFDDHRSATVPAKIGTVPAPGAGCVIVVGAKGQPLVQGLLGDAGLKQAVGQLAAEQYVLKTTARPDGTRIVLVAGGDPVGTLYGAYRLAEHLGIRFYLHGDVAPDEQRPLDALTGELLRLDETGKPLFAHRGIQPFHDFPEGPDWWNADDYKAVIGQLPKLRMNFFGLHTYPQGGVGPEPAVWIGPPGELGPDGKVKASYPSRHFTTSNVTGAWGYRPMKTGDYSFGAAELFDRDDYGADYMRGTNPWPRMSPQQCNDLFDRTGALLGEAFSFARRLGVKTCLGTETPLVIPDAVKRRLQAAGKNPADPAVVQEVYEGMFRRIAAIHPLDYYWFWTPEGWTWEPVSQRQIDATMADFRAAIAAAKRVNAPFTLATCGWVLGPPQTPALFDDTLPKDMPMSCISRTVGNSPVEPGFRNVRGRPKWSIPWLEDDPGLVMPQLWVGRMRRDAADSLAYGCTGLMGIHWRTRILGPNVAALAHAAWDQSGWNSEFGAQPAALPAKPAAGGADAKPRYLPTLDFYEDWARAEFGPQAAKPIAEIFARIDGQLPRPTDWVEGPGGLKPSKEKCGEVCQAYAFLRELEKLRPQVVGSGNRERFDYWLDNFRCLHAMSQAARHWGEFNRAMEEVRAEKNPEARDVALSLRTMLAGQVKQIHRYLLSAVSTPGELGTLANWQQHNLPPMLGPAGEELARAFGERLPPEALPTKEYAGPPRIIVPTVRTGLVTGETLTLKVILAGIRPREANLWWRPLGTGEFRSVPLEHVARSVYRVALPPAATEADFEYYVRVVWDDGQVLHYPATAPRLNQTVVVCEGLP
jgi:hypothetical protein